MPDPKRVWTDDDIAKLKSLAGTMPVRQIAVQLRRSHGATVVEASKLKLSLRMPGGGRSAKLSAEKPACPVAASDSD